MVNTILQKSKNLNQNLWQRKIRINYTNCSKLIREEDFNKTQD